jgi:7-cyano-7-deazaguanine synthase
VSKKAVILLSGGIDSTTTLYFAKDKGFNCHCLIFDYGQRHKREIEAAKKIAKITGCSYQILKISLPWKGSSLLDKKIEIPKYRSKKIPSTYVPARNTIFLSFALSYAETIGAETIFIGANSLDYSGYPDCRPEYYRVFRKIINLGTKAGLEKKRIEIKTPLIHKIRVKLRL